MMRGSYGSVQTRLGHRSIYIKSKCTKTQRQQMNLINNYKEREQRHVAQSVLFHVEQFSFSSSVWF